MHPFRTSHRSAVLSVLLLVLLFVSACTPATATPTAPPPTDSPTERPPEATVEATAAASADEVLVVVGEFPPLTGEALENGGLSVEIVRAAFDAVGVTMRVEFYPWARGEEMVVNGEAWGSFPYVPTEERQSRFLISDPLNYGRTLFFIYGDTMSGVEYDEPSDLARYRVGGTIGYWYLPMLTEAGIAVEEVADDLANLRKLQAGRIDAFPILDYIGYTLIQSNFPDDVDSFQVLETPIDISADTVIVSKTYPNSAALLEQFNSGLAMIRENGVYDAIFARYGLEPFVPEAEPAS